MHDRRLVRISFMTVVLLVGLWTESPAQLDRLRKSRAPVAATAVDTLMAEIPAGEFVMGWDPGLGR
jgi:hypothetical protein